MTAAFLFVLALLLQAPAAIPADTFLQTELKKEITVRRAKPGQGVVLQLTDDVKNNDGAVLIPSGAKLTGKIVVAKKRSGSEPSAFSFLIDKAEWKDASVGLNAVIEQVQALGRTGSDACAPNLNRGSMASCGSSGGGLFAVPADCSVAKVEETPGIVCSKRDLEMGPGTVLILRNGPAPAAK